MTRDASQAIVAGRCRFCGCTEDRPCGVMVFPGPEFPSTAITCEWADEEQTVCSNLACLERWNAELPPDSVEPSRIILP